MPKKEEENSRWIFYVSVAILALLIAGFAFYSVIRSERNRPNSPTTQPTQSEVNLDEGLDLTPPTQGNDPIYDEEYQQEVALRQPEERLKISCDDVALYSGEYVEDGSDEPVEGIASILITNRSGKYLNFLRLTYELDGEPATFEVSDLPSGKSVWILEKNRRKATESSKFVYQEALPDFSDYITRIPDELNVEYADQMMRVTNVSERTFDHVIVYYKRVFKDGNYLGGITYRVDFGTLEPGDSVEKIAGHYENDWYVILRVSYEETTDD